MTSEDPFAVLVVEDSSAMRTFVRATLEEDGETVVDESGSGFEALRLLAQKSYSLVVVDINMPDINGLEIVSFMRRSDKHRDTPLLIISTESSEKDRERGMTLGANAFLSKPFTPEELRAVVARVTARSP